MAEGAFDFDFGAGRRFPRVSPGALAFGPSAPLDPGPGRKWVANASVACQPTDALQWVVSPETPAEERAHFRLSRVTS